MDDMQVQLEMWTFQFTKQKFVMYVREDPKTKVVTVAYEVDALTEKTR